MAKVKCTACKHLENGRCTIKLNYPVIDKPRHCRDYEHEGQTKLNIYDVIRHARYD